MFNSKMYKLEAFANYCINFCDIKSVDNLEEIFTFCIKSRYIKTVKEMDYVRCVCAIPYDKMIDYIDYYDKYVTDEISFVNFIEKIAEKHNVPFRVANKRFEDVWKLSNSLIYKKKLEKIYTIDTEKAKIKK